MKHYKKKITGLINSPFYSKTVKSEKIEKGNMGVPKPMNENLFIPKSIRVFSGAIVNVFDPDPATITIEDIAHALSMDCRFGGHLKKFYSVAEHSIHCSMQAHNAPDQLAMLMHDASEAY